MIHRMCWKHVGKQGSPCTDCAMKLMPSVRLHPLFMTFFLVRSVLRSFTNFEIKLEAWVMRMKEKEEEHNESVGVST